ncbi:MAG: ABC transporter ATP-binding protein [Alphaproteobacteria bacterium]|jgi:ABC-2 type transport system ATP-binding protein|nr:ABC transporter ATP-binding protein [Alphaproteobacteria bacterium]|tara:strand:+ start:116 stop:817 length:702 start_codon:yes stop_codon:yes gene_type:complete
MLIVKDISKNFGEFKAINHLSFEVKVGDVMGFLGPNGAGKTTSMRVITGYLRSDGGTVLINNKDIEQDPIFTKSMIGYLPEGVPLYLDFSPYLYLDYVCQVRNIKNSSKAIKKVISDLQLEEVKDVPIETLSKGFKRRVGIAQALIHNPKLLILDEPTDGLDPLQKFEVRKLIKNLSKTKAIIISTHILDEVPEVCNKCLIINNGEKVFEGTPTQLKRKLGKSLDEKFRKLVS